MTADHGRKRAELIARKDAALERWPSKAGAEFQAGLAEIARDLDTFARSLDEANADAIERLRAWCAVGEANMPRRRSPRSPSSTPGTTSRSA